MYFQLGGARGAKSKIAKALEVHRSFVSRAVAMYRESMRTGVDFHELEICERIKNKLRKQELRMVIE